MKTYKKPIISIDSGLAEGVYAASGFYDPSNPSVTFTELTKMVGVGPGDGGCKNSCVYGKQIFLIRNRYVKLCCRINDYAAVEYIFVLTVLPCRKIIYIIFDFFA